MTTFTGLLVLVGFLQFAVLFVQWRLIRRQDEHFKNSERAWIMAELGWYEQGLHVVRNTSTAGGQEQTLTNVNVKLTCKNDGRSPAWIDHVYGGVEITSPAALKHAPTPDKRTLHNFGPLDPLGEGVATSSALEMQCSGQMKGDEFVSVYVVIEYRDIFGTRRETSAGYSIDNLGNIYRQYGHPERNRNT